MKRILVVLWLFLTLMLQLIPVAEARSYRSKSSDVYVKSYYRKDGTYVNSHYRSAPDGNVWNNYSCIDDGKCGSSGSSFSLPSFDYSLPSYTVPLNIDSEKPSNVTDLIAVPKDGRVDLFWSASNDNVGIKNYLITYDSKPLDLSINIPNVSYCEQTSCYINGLTNGMKYHFYVLPIDTSGNYSQYWSNEVNVIPIQLDNNPPSIVENVKLEVLDRTLYVNWDSATDNEGDVTYKVYWSRNKEDIYPILSTIAKSKATNKNSLKIKKIAEGKTYHVAIFAIDQSNNSSETASVYSIIVEPAPSL